ncbi:zinc finger protein 675-like, partial [Metopolophium dirhodum]|uniref:zinc finger protein 675-like n=1 Tax=Metopolophium dirhodum TaxID=44670 RepID=UPI0029902741
ITSMKVFIQVEVTGDADAVTSERYVENTIENPTWYTVEDNHVSLVSENVEEVIKLETDMSDDWMWESRTEITKDVTNQSNMKLPLECQDVADNNIYLNHENTSDKLFHCNICGKSFELSYLLKNHLAEHKKQINYKTNKCIFCGKQFKLRIGLNKHIQKNHNSSYKCRFCRQNIDFSNYIEHEKCHERKDQTKFDTIPNTKRNIKQKQLIQTTVGDHFQQQTNIQQSSLLRQQSVVPTASQISMANNFDILNMKQEKNLCTNVRERNSSDQVDSVNINELTLANKPRDLMAEQNPINIANNNIVSTVRETLYFCIRKFPNIRNGSRNDYDQTSQNNVIFICKICKNSPSTDIHAFALHMSDHSECNMHECIVCDKTFKSVVLWTHHMIDHEQQIDSNVSTVQFNLFETESKTLGPINSRNTEPRDFPNLRNRKFKKSLLDNSDSDITRLNSANKIKHQYNCITYKKVFPSKSPLKMHQSLHNKSQPFSCRYCDKIFSVKGLCTDHEKCHINSDNLLSKNNENIKLEPNVIQNSISIEDNTDSGTMSRNQNNNLINHSNKSNEKKSTFCMICNKHYAHPGAFTNHMRIHGGATYKCQYCHKQFNRKGIYIMHEKTHVFKNNIEEHTTIHTLNMYECDDCGQQFKTNISLGHHIMENHSANMSTSNKNEHVENYERQNASLERINFDFVQCQICLKILKTRKYLECHMRIHTGAMPFKCDKCNTAFRFKSNLKSHQKKYLACYVP